MGLAGSQTKQQQRRPTSCAGPSTCPTSLYQLLPATTSYYQQSPTTATNCYQLQPPATTNSYHQPPTPTNCYQLLPPTATNYYHQPPTATNCYQLLPPTATNYSHQPPTATNCYQLQPPAATNYCSRCPTSFRSPPPTCPPSCGAAGRPTCRCCSRPTWQSTSTGWTWSSSTEAAEEGGGWREVGRWREVAGGGGGERGGAGVVAASWRGIFGRVMAVRARDLVAIRGAPCALPASLVYPFLHGPFNLPPPCRGVHRLWSRSDCAPDALSGCSHVASGVSALSSRVHPARL